MMHTASPLILRVATRPIQSLSGFGGHRAEAFGKWLARLVEARTAESAALTDRLYTAAGVTAPPELAPVRVAVLALRRAIHQDRGIRPEALERAAPLLATELRDRIRRWSDDGRRIERSRQSFPKIFAASERREREGVIDSTPEPLVALGLRLVSRSLAHRAAAMGSADSWGQRERHTASKVVAYLGRFATKTSPNGVFCATALAELTDGDAELDGANRIAKLDFVINVGEARKVTDVLAASPEAESTVVPRVNPSLRGEGGVWTLWRPACARRSEDDEILLQIKDHPLLRAYLEATDGRTPAGELVATVSTRVGQDTSSFYRTLVERGVLIAEVEIPWSERRPLRSLASRCGPSWSFEMEAIESEVDALANRPWSEIPARLDAITPRLGALPRVRPLVEDDAIRCDAATALRVRLPRALLTDLERLLPHYARFYGAIYPEALIREAYAKRFLTRYPPDRPIPVLDFYHGLFEPVAAPALAAFESAGSSSSGSPLRAGAGRAFEHAREFFVRRALEAETTGEEEVVLTDGDWDAIAGDAPAPGFACAALFQVATRSVEEIASTRTRVCLNALFPGAGLSVARLAHLHQPAGGRANPIEGLLREGWSRRERDGAVFAEITYMHAGRTANAGLRPSLFRYEIELPGNRASAGREAIPLADLTATWDAAAQRFHLRWTPRGLEVLPVISSGIDPEGFVSFLTMVGGHGIQPLGLLPGFDLPEVRRWPRFRFGNVVLFRRRWAFAASDLPHATSPGAHFLETQRWAHTHSLPRHVFVHTDIAPKPFFVDLGSVLFVDLLRRSLASGGSRVHVTEMLPGFSDLWVRDAAGRYASEFLVHMDNLDQGSGGRA